ncbi:VanZ family protein [Knoellia sp. S7-12]|uniref:VanZ family protein n=1 Tax=Knoellia sp. S7-12 TaxID=3126698 RepID=UPI003366EAF0
MTGEGLRRWSSVPAIAAVLFQLGVLYAPSGAGSAPFPNFDKLVHCAVFALPVFFAVLARLPMAPVIAVLAVHAPVSEFIQATLLPNRSGDPWDVVADLVGVTLGAAAARFALHRRPTAGSAT